MTMRYINTLRILKSVGAGLSAAILVVGAITVSDAFAKEADIHSANAVVPGCRFFDGSTTSKNPRFDPFGQGYCVGLLNGLDYDGVRCRPPEIAWGQLVRVVLKYIDIRPERMHHAPAFRGGARGSASGTQKRWVGGFRP